MDRKGFLEHYAATERAVRAYRVGATGSHHEADDLVQAVWRILWEKFDAYDAGRPFAAWAMGIARYEVLNWRRRRQRSPTPLSEDTIAALAETAAEHAPDLGRRHSLLLRCLDELDDGRRRIVRMKYYDGLTIADIAGRTRRTVAAIEMALVRVRRALGECIERKLLLAATVTLVRHLRADAVRPAPAPARPAAGAPRAEPTPSPAIIPAPQSSATSNASVAPAGAGPALRLDQAKARFCVLGAQMLQSIEADAFSVGFDYSVANDKQAVLNPICLAVDSGASSETVFWNGNASTPLPASGWMHVRIDCVREGSADAPVLDTRWYYDDELVAQARIQTKRVTVMLEVTQGAMVFRNVVVRERVPTSAAEGVTSPPDGVRQAARRHDVFFFTVGRTCYDDGAFEV